MNNRRKYTYEVVIVAEGEDSYYSFDQRVKNAAAWLQWNTKRRNWTRGTTTYNQASFLFKSSTLASWFALKWTK